MREASPTLCGRKGCGSKQIDRERLYIFDDGCNDRAATAFIARSCLNVIKFALIFRVWRWCGKQKRCDDTGCRQSWASHNRINRPRLTHSLEMFVCLLITRQTYFIWQFNDRFIYFFSFHLRRCDDWADIFRIWMRRNEYIFFVASMTRFEMKK